MATYQFSALSDGQALSFNPSTDILNFDQSFIGAADLRVVTEGSNIRINLVSGSSAGKDVLLLSTAQPQLATSNITFADGSKLLFGDNTAAQTADNSANSLAGTAGRDLLEGFGGSDTLTGGAGNDVLDGGTQFDRLIGGAGNDTFLFSVAATGANADLIVDFASGADKIALDTTIYSNAGALGDFAAGDVRFFAGAGATTGHDANDRLIYNTTNGTLWYDPDGSGSAPSQLIATLQGALALTASDITVASSSAPAGGGGGGSVINGTAGDDSIAGTAGNDTINGLGGNDTIGGNGGADSINGGDGDDNITGGFDDVTPAGGDTLIGGNGNDTLDGTDQTMNGRTITADRLDGGLGNDYFKVDTSDDVVVDSGGFDTIEAKDISWTLGAGIENLRINNDVSEGGRTGIGNELNNEMWLMWGGGELHGLDGSDILHGGVLGSFLFGDAGNDVLIGDAGGLHPAVLDGGTGDDTLVGGTQSTGGAGADTFDLSRGGTAMDFASATDHLRLDGSILTNTGASGDFAAGDQRFYSAAGATAAHDASDRLIYDTSTGDLYYDQDGTGSADAFLLGHLQGAPSLAATDVNVINGSGGSSSGSVINGTPGNDTLNGTSGNDTINGLGGDDQLSGGEGADSLSGGSGNDTLDAGELVPPPGDDNAEIGDGQPDTLDGGLGDDVYGVHEAGDTIIDAGGVDLVNATNTSWTLGAGLENLFVQPMGRDYTGTGNELDNRLSTDTSSLSGFGGGTVHLHGAGGNDTVDGGLGAGGISDLYGDEGNDTIIAATFGSSMTGGAGADSFVLRNSFGDQNRISDFASGVDKIHLDENGMTQLGAGGNFSAGDARFFAAAGATGGHDADDRVVYDTASGKLYYDADGNGSQTAQLIVTLQPGAALAATDIAVDNAGSTFNGTAGNDSINGTGGSDTLSGFGGNDTLNGLGGNDSLDGGAGQDVLDGGTGRDTMAGGADNDTYFVDDVNDQVVELSGGGAHDLVISTVPVNNYILPAFVNDLTFAGTGFQGSGNELDNIITGSDLNNTMRGLAGNDVMAGNGGNDVLLGGDGIDDLSGGDGADTLDGGTGQNFLTGGAGADTFLFTEQATEVDLETLRDFASGVDTVMLDGTLIWNLGDSGRFSVGDDRFFSGAGATTAHDASDRIIFDTSNGWLYFDADGTASSWAPQHFASLKVGDTFVATDVVVINGTPRNGENFVGTSGDDNHTGTAGDDNIEGRAGNDTLDGSGGNDVVIGDEGNDSLIGGSGNDVLEGRSGDDVLIGGPGIDELRGEDGNDTLDGGTSGDFLTGGAGADRFLFTTPPPQMPVASNEFANISDFVSGTDRLVFDRAIFTGLGATGDFTAGDGRFYAAPGATGGHDADDRLVYDTTNGRLYYDADGSGAGAAKAVAGFPIGTTLAATDITVAGGAGGGSGQTINGTPGNDNITGTAGDDVISGLAGDDVIFGDPIDSPQQGNDTISGGDGNDVINGRGGDDVITGDAGDDSFVMDSNSPDFPDAFPGNDSIDGGTGIDWIDFSTESVSSTGAIVLDLGAGTYSIDDSRGQILHGTVLNVENAQGSAFTDNIRGSTVANIIDGFFGDDTILGLGGDDQIKGSFGNDHVEGGAGNDFLEGDDPGTLAAGNDYLDGGAGNDTLLGGDGADVLAFTVAPGAANADFVADFAPGSDKILLDGTVHANSGTSGNFAAGDARFWSSTNGTAHDADDRVLYNSGTGELWYDADGNGAGARQLIATLQGAPTLAATDIAIVNGSGGGGGGGSVINGTAGNDTLTGTAGNDSISGLAGADVLSGLAGNDTLNGGDGVDTLDGGAGDDTYIVTAGDVLSDSGGIDTVISDASWTLAPNVFENLTLTGTTATSAQGNNLDNRIEGNAANNSINGRAGNDMLLGAAGNDTFDMSTGGTSSYGTDTIDGGAGTDTVDFGANARTGINANLVNGTLSGGGDAGAGSATLASIENVIGGNFNDVLTGNASANFFYGGVGNDALAGGAGSDRLQGAGGNDTFVFANSGGANADLVLDFVSASDKLAMDNAFFTAIGADGNFAAGDARFFAAAGATSGHDASDRIVYNSTTGNLYYDADGSGAGAAQLVATIQGHPAVTATDISVI